MQSFNASELSILLVEPSAVQLKIILRELHQAGITKVDSAHNGGEAVALLQKYPPDLVISAMYLPDMTAIELLSDIRGLDKLDNTYFMLISSESKTEALEPLRQSGVVAILPKPFDRENLRRAIRTTLDYIDPAEITLQNYDVDQLEVLLVDDSMVSRNQLSRVLSNMGIIRIHLAENGAEAIEKLRHSLSELPAIDNYLKAIGTLYVIEGSTLGGQIICNMISRQWEIIPEGGFDFFSGYGKDTHAMWSDFKKFLNSNNLTREEEKEVVKAANRTFVLFKTYILRNESCC